MAHVDDLTFINAAQILGSDNLYLGRPSDTADPDKRTDVDELISRIIGPDAALPLVFLRVTSAGVAINAPGQPSISGALISTGIFELTAPIGYTWFTATGSGVSASQPRIVNCNPTTPGGRVLRVYIFDIGGTPVSVEHAIAGALRPD